MNIKIPLPISLALLIICCSSSQKSTPAIDFNRFLPEHFSGYERTGNLKSFLEKSLASQLGDSAEYYISYGATQLARAEYRKNSTIYSIKLFRFSDILGAFGIYSHKRGAEDTFISVGTESILNPQSVYYFKDRFYMTINSHGDELPDLESLRQLAAAIDSLLPGPEMFPRQFDIFPDKRLITRSQKFWPYGFTEYSAPDSCYSADYLRKGRTCRLFYASGKTVAEYDSFVKLIERSGRILTHMAAIGKNSVYAITDDEKKILVGFSDGIIYGVLDVANDYWAKALCEALFENMGKEL